MATASDIREATPDEARIFNEIRRFYAGQVAANVKGALAMAELIAAGQKALDKAMIFDPILWNKTRQKQIDLLLNQYNTLGRIFAQLDGRRYGIRPTPDGLDFDIIAPRTLAPQEYTDDIYPLGQLQVFVFGVVLVAAILLVMKALDYNAQSQQAEFKKAILDADQTMASMPAKVRADYGRWKLANIDLIKAANAAPQGAGLLDRLLGAGAGAGVGAIFGVGLLAFIFVQLAKRQPQREAVTA
jgi:hypothetical protein